MNIKIKSVQTMNSTMHITVTFGIPGSYDLQINCDF